MKSKKAKMRKQRDRWVGVASVLLLIVVWEVMDRTGYSNRMIVSSPTQILLALSHMITSGSLASDLYISGKEFLAGFLLAVVVGIPLGILSAWYSLVDAALAPYVSALYATPRIALFPLFILWFGIGLESKVAMIFFGAIFPILINTYTGFQTLDSNLVRAARSFGASDWQVFRIIGLPGSVPNIVTGLRMGVAQGLVSMVVGEMVIATGGVGKIVADAGQNFMMDQMFAGILIIAAASVILLGGLDAFRHRFDAWRPRH